MVTKRSEHPSKGEGRFGVINASDIAERRVDLQQLVNRCRTLLLNCEMLRVTGDIPIDGAAKWKAGIGMLEGYLDNVERSIIRQASSRIR